jgi:Gram-negative porin
MRKILLSTMAALGAAVGLAGTGYAQTTAATTTAMTGTTAPNSFKVRLDARINWYAGVAGDSSNGLGGYKSDPYGFQGYIRVYPGFDAVAANGLQYGVAAEIRMPGSGGGGGHAGTSPGSTSSAMTLYWRRAYGYVGTPQLGKFEFGMVDGTMDNSAFYVGSFEGFNDGAWNGDVPGFVTGSTTPAYPFSDVGGYYTADRVVYLSPSFSGFQFGVAFAPNTNNLWNGNCSTAGSSCNTLSASPVAADQKRWRNLIDAGIGYTGAFGPVGVALGGAYAASNMVEYNGGAAPLGTTYNGYSFGDFGGTLTFAGFTVGGQVGYGRMNGDWSPQPKGGQNELAFMLGGQYTVGPIVVGGSYFKTKYAGGWTEATTTVARAETDQGIAAGATYSLVPGMALYLSYLYGLRHQIGYDFYTGAPGTAGNNTRSQAFALGTVLKW